MFMYHPIGHVTIYIGNGLMVSAPEPGDHVKVVTVASQQDIYVGATSFTQLARWQLLRCTHESSDAGRLTPTGVR